MIKVDNLSNTYVSKNTKVEVLKDINLYCKKNEFVSIIGPSGCGKSTLFKILSGLMNEYTGSFTMNKKVVYMHQNDNLMPWRTIYQNIILPYEIQNIEPNKNYVSSLVSEFELEGFMDVYPSQLSGGMKKRVALLRTYLTNREIMLLDEPFGSLDAITKKSMYSWLLKIWNNHKKTVLFITHDIDEAIFLSDRIYVMGKRPATIVGEITINFKRPRSQEILLGKQYLEYKDKLQTLLTK